MKLDKRSAEVMRTAKLSQPSWAALLAGELERLTSDQAYYASLGLIGQLAQ